MAPKILCFHGWRTSAEIISFQLGTIKRALPRDWQFVCIDAPMKSLGKPDEDIANFFGDDHAYYQWWDSKDIHTGGSLDEKDTGGVDDNLKEYVGVQDALEHAWKIIHTQGPFRGILGFSQGGILVSLLTSLMEKALKPEDIGFIPAHLRWQFAVVVSSLAPRDVTFEASFRGNAALLRTPSIHVFGTADSLLRDSEMLASRWAGELHEVDLVANPQTKAVAPKRKLLSMGGGGVRKNNQGQGAKDEELRDELFALMPPERLQVRHSEGHRFPSPHYSPGGSEAVANALQSFARSSFYAFDFDGVLCRSHKEAAVAGWKAGEGVIKGASFDTEPPADIVRRFELVRPALETGWQAILLVKLLVDLQESEDVNILRSGSSVLQNAIEQAGLTEDELKERFHDTRNRWIATDEPGWLATHSFYDKAVDTVKKLIARGERVYIITTKHKDFAVKLLERGGLELPASHVYGLGSGPKGHVLQELMALPENKGAMPMFVEDRWDTLETVIKGGSSSSAAVGVGHSACRVALASWGYNTRDHRSQATNAKVPVLIQADLLRWLDAEA